MKSRISDSLTSPQEGISKRGYLFFRCFCFQEIVISHLDQSQISNECDLNAEFMGADSLTKISRLTFPGRFGAASRPQEIHFLLYLFKVVNDIYLFRALFYFARECWTLKFVCVIQKAMLLFCIFFLLLFFLLIISCVGVLLLLQRMQATASTHNNGSYWIREKETQHCSKRRTSGK